MAELAHIFSFFSGILLAALICSLTLIVHYRHELKMLTQVERDTKFVNIVEPGETGESEKTDVTRVEVSEPMLMNKQDKAEQADDQMFKRITETIRREQLYLASEFGRTDIVNRFQISAHRAGMLFSKRQTSIPDFVRNCRLEHAQRLIAKHPETSLSDIAAASGFIHLGTFMHDFKDKYGMTPARFRKSLTSIGQDIES